VAGGLTALVSFAPAPRTAGREAARRGELRVRCHCPTTISSRCFWLPGVIVLLTEDALGGWRRTLALVAKGTLPAIVLGLVPYVTYSCALGHRSGFAGCVSRLRHLLVGDLCSSLPEIGGRAPTTSFGERLVDAAVLLTTQWDR